MKDSTRFSGSSPDRQNDFDLQHGASWSGHERNHLFVSGDGRSFTDISGVSGVDHPGDSRCFGILDYDRDGWLDLAVVNSNAPQFQLFRNQLGADSPAPHYLALRLVGGNDQATANPDWSPRDGYGALVTVKAGDLVIKREHRCGEGFAAQNSATMLIGLGRHETIDELEIRWPSGRSRKISGLRSGQLVTIHENPERSPSAAGFVSADYRSAPAPLADAGAPVRGETLALSHPESQASLRLYLAMATWCPSCKAELTQVKEIREAMPTTALAMFGVPCDEALERAQLEDYVTTLKPAYEMLMDLPAAEVATVQRLVRDKVGGDVVPACVVTDARGRVILVRQGLPTVSDLRKLLRLTEGG